MTTPVHPLLSQLKDIHLPPAPSLWPLALGWYLVIVLLVSGFCLIGYLAIKHYQANRYRKSALIELNQLEAGLSHSGAISLAIEKMAILLKRTALVAYSQHRGVAGLTGEAWLVFLDDTGGTTAFTKGVGRILLVAPYQGTTDTSLPELIQLCREWITTHKRIKNQDV